MGKNNLEPENVKTKQDLLDILAWKVEEWYEDGTDVSTVPSFVLAFREEGHVAHLTNAELEEYIFILEFLKHQVMRSIRRPESLGKMISKMLGD